MISRDHLLNEVRDRGLIGGLSDAFGLLASSEKRHALLLLVSMTFNALLGLVGLAGVLPFIQLMLEKDPLGGAGLTGRVLRALGFTNVGHALIFVGATLIALILLKNIYALVHTGWQSRFCANAEVRMSAELLSKVVSAPYAWLVTQNSTILTSVITGSTVEWSRTVIRASLQLANDVLFLVAAFSFLVAASPVTGVVVSITAAAVAYGLVSFARPKISHYVNLKRKAARLAGVASTEAIAGGRDVRISGIGPILISSYLKDTTTYAHSDGLIRQWQMVPRLGIEVIGFAAIVGIALGALWSGTARTEVATLLALYAVIAVRVIPMVTQMVVGITTLSGNLGAIYELTMLSNELNTLPPFAGTEPAPAAPSWSTLRLERVEFSFPGARLPAIGPLSVDIVRGRTYGIVGSSGAGKSTLVDVLTGLLAPTRGRIMLDNRELAEPSDVAAWRRAVAYVAQTPFLLDASLRDNIEFGGSVQGGSDARIAAAIAAAGLQRVVEGLPDGLSSRLGDRGVRLSGGQRQRVAIARALFRDADLLVLDEATSALDSLTEREITDEIDRLKGKVTLVIVAHRLSTVVRCDEILVLDEGQLLARGSHSELMATSSLYRRMIEAQSVPEII